MANDKVCPKCGESGNGERYFCKKCGVLLDEGMFADKKTYGTEEFKMMRILENLKYTPHNKIIWNDTVDLYTSKVEKFKALAAIPEMKIGNSITEEMERFLYLCTNSDFQIAFVGTIKTGKSTLINALLGDDYASMAVTPETAALTKFRSSPKDYVNVTFYSPEEWKKLWDSRTSAADAFMREYNKLKADKQKDKWVGHEKIHKELSKGDIKKELEKWSSSKSAEHYFVKEIEVGISSLPSDFPKQVVFVDTPGLSDPVAYRSEITRGYIRNANAVFVCVEAKKLQKEEIETIADVFSFSSHNKNKVHIIATHWDKLNDPEEDWELQKEWFKKNLVGKAFFDDVEMAHKNIMHSSAYIYNQCRKLEASTKIDLITFAQKTGIIDETGLMAIFTNFWSIKKHLSEIQEKTNIPEINRVINEELAKNYKDLLAQDIEQTYFDINLKLKTIAEEGKKDAESIIQVSYKDIQDMRNKVEEQKEKCAEIATAVDRLKKVLSSVEKATQKRLEKILPHVKA